MSLPTTPTQQNADPSPPPPQPISATTDKPATIITINPPALPPETDHSSADPQSSQSNDQPSSDSKWEKMNHKVQNFLERLSIKTVYYTVLVIQILLFCWDGIVQLCNFWNVWYCQYSGFLYGMAHLSVYLAIDVTTRIVLYIHLFLHLLTKKPSTWYKRATFFNVLLLPLLAILFCLDIYHCFYLQKDLPPVLGWTQTVLNYVRQALFVFSVYQICRKCYHCIVPQSDIETSEFFAASSSPLAE